MTIASPQTLVDRAMTETGLSDFGPEGWREGLDHLVAALSERDFGEIGQARFEKRLCDVLSTRLRIESWIAAHPGLLEAEIDGPVFILGLPRTATTALQAFLANDPQWRFLRGWELADPTPPPDIATEPNDPRMLAERARSQPEGVGHNMHIAEAGGPVDDLAPLRLDFHNQEIGWPAWSYTEWWRNCDMRTAYAYHARVLKLLQSRRPPNRWLVKAPWHNFHIDALARQYPSARFIMCHRDPTQLIPSVASVVRAAHHGVLGYDANPPEAIGAFVSEHYAISIRRVLQFRRDHGDSRFIDIRHRDFNADPFAATERIYAWLNMDLPPAARIAMAAWQQRNRRGTHGEHRYSAEEFGLTAQTIQAAFSDYMAQFAF